MQRQRRLVIRASKDLTQVLYLVEEGREEPLSIVPPNFKPEIEDDLMEILRKRLGGKAGEVFVHKSIGDKRIKDILGGD
jgi:hypothetical protein